MKNILKTALLLALLSLTGWGGAAISNSATNVGHSVLFFPSASDPLGRQGFARVVNRSNQIGTASITAFDDAGQAYGPITLNLDALQTVHFNSGDLEDGNSAKGLPAGVGRPFQGDWRLELASDLDLKVLSYIRTADGFVTSMHDVAPSGTAVHQVAFLNPGSNYRQESLLRVVNPGDGAASVAVSGVDDRGVAAPSGVARFTVQPRAASTFTAAELEDGAAGLSGSLGDGTGKWRLEVEADVPVQVMSLLATPTGHLTNLSTDPRSRSVLFFPSSSDPLGRQGFVRVVNQSNQDGEVSITAFDDAGQAHGPIALTLDALQTMHFNSGDFEDGNAAKGLPAGVGRPSQGDWRLELASDLDIKALSYIRTSDGFVTSMHDVVPSGANIHRVAFFNPGSNYRQESLLRVVNPGDSAASVSVRGVDDRGVAVLGPGSSGNIDIVRLSIPPRAARSFTAADLEGGAMGLDGSLGDGVGKWRLEVEADVPIQVMSLLATPTGHLTNLSTDPSAVFDGMMFSSPRVITTDVNHGESAYAADLDGDGDFDVLTASFFDDKIAWHENLGGGAFSEQRIITTAAQGAEWVHAVDLDGDGDADVLTASQNDDKIAWHENLGDGAFSEQRVITTQADGARSVHAADLDGDGDADVLSASVEDDKIAWHENLGGGEFSAQRVITTNADGAYTVHAADLDGDGDADVLSASGRDSKIAWYANLGGGAFSAQRVITTNAADGISVYASDLDGDGDMDVLSASWIDDKIAWYENLGEGAFSAQRVIATVEGAISVHAADLDGDGDADVLSASYLDDKIAWHENLSDHGDDHGDGQESATLATVLPATLQGTLESAGDRDLFRVATGKGTLRVWSNGPTDTYGTLMDADGEQLAADDDSGVEPNFRIDAQVSAGVHYVEVRGYEDDATGPYTLSIEFVDNRPRFDSSGPEDLSYTASTAIAALTLPAASGGSGSLTYSLTPAVPGLSFDPATRRLSGTPTAAGDYAMTYSATDAEGNSVSWMFTISVGGQARLFSAQRVITTDADRAYSVHAADLDDDGDPDVLSASYQDDKIAWYENLGGGSFSAQRVITTDADGARVVYAADLDGDGDPDVLSASEGDDKIAWHENLGGGSFSAQHVITTDASGENFVHAADLDGDGDADVLSASRSDDTIAWYENLGNGEFAAQRAITVDADGALSVLAADLDSDGDPDLLSAWYDGDRIVWHENMGGGEFSVGRAITTDADGANRVRAADLDGDGDLDVLYAAQGSGVGNNAKVAWHENLGGGAFSTERLITADVQQAGDVHAADLDGDRDLDVLYSAFNGRKVAWSENQGNGVFAEQRVIADRAEIDHPTSVRAADLDGDGDADVLYTASFNRHVVAWHENLSNHGDDHGGTPDEATLATAFPAFLHGVLESVGDLDLFRVATGNGTLRVYSNGPTDTVGTLLDGTGNQLASNDDGGTSTNFMIELEVAAGSHYVQVRGSSSATTGPYTLSIEFEAGRLQFDTNGPANQDYTVGTTIAALTLPTASGVSGTPTYSLTPNVPGLSFDPSTRRLSGTPTAADDYVMTYTATDANGDSISWTFTISVAAAPSGAQFSGQRVVTTEVEFPRSMFAADLDGDGDPDLLSASSGDNQVAWYENLGDGAFAAKRVIATDADGGVYSVYAADLDRDGDADVLSAGGTLANSINKVAWYENLGRGTFSDQQVITTHVLGPLSVHAADLDGDGDADVLSASADGNKIAWYENLGGGEFPPEQVDPLGRVIEAGVITTDADGANSVYAADMDGDGDADVLSASSRDDKIAWYENMGGGEFSAQRVITTDADGAEKVYATDLDGDGDADVLFAAWGSGVGNNAKVAWHENLGGGAFSTQRVITDDAQGATDVHAVDLDGDRDVDVLHAAFNASKVAWNENLGTGSFAAQRIVAQQPEIRNPNVVHAADIDGDGDADMLYSLLNDQTIAWRENQSDHGDDHGDAPASATLVTSFPAFVHGTLESSGDRDVFRVAASSGGTIHAYSNGPTDTYGRLMYDNGFVLTEHDDTGTGVNFRLGRTGNVPATGYYIEVSGSGDATGPYTLTIEFEAN